MKYKGYYIDRRNVNTGEFVVFYNGKEHNFRTIKEAIDFINRIVEYSS